MEPSKRLRDIAADIRGVDSDSPDARLFEAAAEELEKVRKTEAERDALAAQNVQLRAALEGLMPLAERMLVARSTELFAPSYATYENLQFVYRTRAVLTESLPETVKRVNEWREDSERLDWLLATEGNSYFLWLKWNPNIEPQKPTRKVIDEAMEQGKGAEDAK